MDIAQDCSTHEDRTAGWYCWNCGLPFCEECVQPWQDQYICDTCLETLESDDEDPFSGKLSWPKQHREAGMFTRLLAFFIDFTLISIATMALSWLLHNLLNLKLVQTQYLYWVIFYGGLVFRDALLPGGSPGKRAVGLYVWNLNLDRPVSGIDSIRRNLVLVVFFFDILTIPFTEQRQRVGDILAGTKVCIRSSGRSEQKDLMRLAGIIFLNLALIFSMYIGWLRFRSQERITARRAIEKNVTADNIVELLRDYGEGTDDFSVVKRTDGLLVEAEATSADEYYRIRRDVVRLLKEASYEITSSDKPELVFRGEGNVRFRLRIEASHGKD